MSGEKKKYQQITSDYIVQTMENKLHLVKFYDFVNKLSAYTVIEGEITLGKLQAAKVRIDELFSYLGPDSEPYIRQFLDKEDLLNSAYFGDEKTHFTGLKPKSEA